MSDVISVEGLGTISLLELVERLSKKALQNQFSDILAKKFSGRGSEINLKKG